MPITEVFPNAPVAEVAFEARFPSLFYLPERIGDLQLKLMDRFPHSSVGTRRQLVLADVDEGGLEQVMRDAEKGGTTRTWHFRSDDDVSVEVRDDRIILSSRKHQTYAQGDEDANFRNAIQSVVDAFREVIALPRFSRVGLIYVDHLPIPDGGFADIPNWYNTMISPDRFTFEAGSKLELRSEVGAAGQRLIVMESLVLDPNEPQLQVSFDAYGRQVPAADYLAITDVLHDIGSDAFQDYIKEPALARMRGE